MGGRLSVSRGRGRGAGCGSALGHVSVSLDPSSVGGSDQTVAQGIFQFGSVQSSVGRRADEGPSYHDSGPPSCFTPGEGGGQTSSSAAVSP